MPTHAPPLYRFGRWIVGAIFHLGFRIRVHGQERTPLTGGLLLAANHLSFADPPLLGWVMPRPVQFMTAKDVFERPVLRWILPRVAAFPVDRSRTDARAAREAVRRLRHGGCVAIFPEGGIRLGEKSVLGGQPKLRPGAAPIAQLGRCPILPVILRNTRATYDWRNWLRRPALTVTIGAPFCLWTPAGPGRDALEDLIREQLLATVALE